MLPFRAKKFTSAWPFETIHRLVPNVVTIISLRFLRRRRYGMIADWEVYSCLLGIPRHLRMKIRITTKDDLKAVQLADEFTMFGEDFCMW